LTITRWAARVYTCLSGDTKPPSNSSMVGARLTETDTGNIYRNSGNEWELFQSKNKTETFSDKTIDSETNTVNNLALGNPFKIRSGSILQSISTTNSMIGCMQNLNVLGDGITTPTLTFIDNTEGFGHFFTRETTGLLGFASDDSTNSLITRRDYNPFFKCRIKANNSSGVRLYVGFTSATAISNNDTPLGDSDSGVIWGFRNPDSNFSVFNNDGEGSAIVTSMGLNKNESFHTVSFSFSTSNVIVVMDDGAGAKTQTLTTRIPAVTTDIKLSMLLGVV
jgi:hypothetical protein